MSVKVFTSKVQDGNMLIHTDKSNRAIARNRQKFLAKHGLKIDRATRVDVVYEGTNYRRYLMLGSEDFGRGMSTDDMEACDAIITKEKDHALVLALADCIGAAIYDPSKEVLMLSHFGRHSLEQNGATASIEFLKKKFGSNPKTIEVILSPSAGSENYPLYSFDNRSMQDVTIEQLQKAGVQKTNVKASNIDTTTNKDYFSHSQYLSGHRSNDGRFAVVAVMY